MDHKQHNHASDVRTSNESAHHEHSDRPRSKVRLVNACVAALLIVYFLIHAVLGVAEVGTPWRGALEWMVWLGVVAIVVHICLCAATTYSMWTDKERPASDRKKRHQIKKWLTGGLMLVLAVAHIATGGIPLDGPSAAKALLAAVLLAVLAWHACVGARSLNHDLRFPRELRAWICTLVVVACLTIAAFLGIVEL